MSTTGSEFRVRALFDFNGQDPNELSFKTDEILTVTSTAQGGEGWWNAVDANGQAGVVPENHLEMIDPFTTRPPPVEASPIPDQSVEPNPNDEFFGSNEQPVFRQSETSLYGNMTPAVDWPPYEPSPVAAPFDQPTNETDLFDPLSLISEGPTSNTGSTGESYATMTEVTHSTEPRLLINADPVPTDQPSDWYVSSDNMTVPTWSQEQLHESDAHFGYDYPQPSQNTTSVTSLDDNFYMAPTSYPQSSATTESFYDSPAQLFSPPNPSNPFTASLPPQATPPTPEPVFSPLPTTNGTAPTRKTPKSDDKKRRASTDVLTDPGAATASSSKPSDNGSDFDDSGHHTASAGHQETGASESKATSKARFFDKHGLDNYILNGVKSKSEEHVAIAYDVRQGGVFWAPHPTNPPFTCTIEDPSKGTKLGGLKTFIEYKIHAQVSGSRVVGRRYKQFDWLHEQLMNKYRFICIPPLPGKQVAGRFEQEFIEERRRQLELWLNRICHHPVLCASFPVHHFVSCELTEKNNKDWKAGKRKSEKDDMREAPWLHCVTLNSSCPADTPVVTQIEAFTRQQPALELHMKNLSLGLSKYVEQHTGVYERDIQRIGELFGKLHTALIPDVTTDGNQQLSSSIAQISASYRTIAELYKTKASDGLRFFNEHLQDYIGILACFPPILGIQKSEVDFIRTVQQRGPTATADYNGALERHNIFNHVILAEINLFQKDKVHDLHNYMKTIMTEQIQFYERVTNELRTAVDTLQ